MATLIFNANDVAPTTEYQPLAGREVLAEITPRAEATNRVLATTSSWNTRHRWPCKGRKVWDRLCLTIPRAHAKDRPRQSLGHLCHAVGVMSIAFGGTSQPSLGAHRQVQEAGGHRRDQQRGEGYAKRESAVGQPQQAPVNDQTPHLGPIGRATLSDSDCVCSDRRRPHGPMSSAASHPLDDLIERMLVRCSESRLGEKGRPWV